MDWWAASVQYLYVVFIYILSSVGIIYNWQDEVVW